MNRRPWGSILLTVFSVALAPIAIAFGVNGMPSFSGMVEQKTADIVGVWVMTWGLIGLAVVAALVVGWLAWSAEDATRQLDNWTSPETGSQPESATRFVA
jgi:hypothetical protein